MGQELSSAKYYQESLRAAEKESPAAQTKPAASAPQRAAVAPPSALERWSRYATPAVGACLVLGAGAAFWLNRAELAEDASYVDKRISNPFNLVMWMGGSEKTFDEALGERFEEVINEIEKESAKDWESASPLGSSFEGVDLSNLNVGFGPTSSPTKPTGGKKKPTR